jgi:D-glycero-alpha-D-manno-heptose 1-phosphate guanylyltransferase
MLEALVLAGGLGTRLRAVVADVPKPMAPVAGRPFLEILLRQLERQGVRHAVLSVGHMADVIERHFGPRFGAIEIHYEVETKPLGTGGAIRRALARCGGDAALVVNGDTLLELELAAVAERWQARHQTLIIGREVPDTARYGRLRVDGDRLTGFAEKGVTGPGPINTGHYVLPTALFDGFDLPEVFSFENDFLVPHVETLGIEVFMARGRFIDIGIPEDYRRAQTELADLA